MCVCVGGLGRLEQSKTLIIAVIFYKGKPDVTAVARTQPARATMTHAGPLAMPSLPFTPLTQMLVFFFPLAGLRVSVQCVWVGLVPSERLVS